MGIGLAQEGKKVLLVDLDPQASLTISLGYPQPDTLQVTVSDLIKKTIMEKLLEKAEGILHQAEGVDILPSNIEFQSGGR